MQFRSIEAIQHEEALVRAFILPDRQERCIYLLGNAKRRLKFTRQLGHFSWFNPQHSLLTPWMVDPTLPLWERHLQGTRNIFDLLYKKGSGKTCWAISSNFELDGNKVDLEEALSTSSDIILSCIPGRLGYFKGEDESLLLERQERPRNL